MSDVTHPVEIERIQLRDVTDALHRSRPFAEVDLDHFCAVEFVDRVTAAAGATLVEPGDPLRAYWLVLDGEIRAERPDPDGSPSIVGCVGAGQGFGEVHLFTGKTESPFYIIATQETHLLRFSEDSFWSLLSCCPAARKVVLADMAQRLKTHQQEAVHREKLVSLGTMAAGLMHELNNPGTAAKRAASKLRENLTRLQELSLRHASKQKTPDQMKCMHDLLQHAMGMCHAPAMSSIEQSDAEEAMSEWLNEAGVANAYKVGPALVEIGFRREDLECARAAFESDGFSDALNWLEALVSSVSLVCAIEESISRVSELAMSVKKFAYEERSLAKLLDVHDNLQSTLTLLGHKLAIKQITVEKRFEASPSMIETRGAGISQVWTNLIDNAVDASPDKAKIEVSTWSEPGSIVVSIVDQGAGIPADVMPHIFDAFYTTKAQGSGTGLGLEIVQRIVTQKFGGTIAVESEPGKTQFIVRLPLKGPSGAGTPAKPVQ
jgi:signal transduction histidine kinase